jgi:hypothetical protein
MTFNNLVVFNAVVAGSPKDLSAFSAHAEGFIIVLMAHVILQEDKASKAMAANVALEISEFYLVWIRMCAFRLVDLANLRWHTLQAYGFFPECERTCIVKSSFL